MSDNRKIRVLHCITSLDADGAQHMLLKLCEHMPASRFEFQILNLRHPTPFAERFAALGVPVEHVGMRRALPTFSALRRVKKSLETFQPDLIQGWMYHGNLAALAGRAAASHKPPVIWNIRKAVASVSEYRPLTRLALKVGAALSRRAVGVIYCGQYIASQHSALGFCASNQVVIPNGFDTTLLQPSAEAYRQVRSSLGVADSTPLVGMVARYHPHKDHPNFLRSAARVAADFPSAHFVLAGRGLDKSNRELQSLADELGLADRLHLMGECSNIENLLPAFDVYCLSSSAEGFPNSLGEAMSCGVPCVTTDAGASAEAVGDTGVVVPVGDPGRLADGTKELLGLSAEERRLRGARARERIERFFALPVIAGDYAAYYTRILNGCPAIGSPEAIAERTTVSKGGVV